MTELMDVRRTQAAGGLMLAVLVAAVFWIAQGPLSAMIAAGWVVAALAVLHFGRKRSDAITVLGGSGDERARSLHTRALAFAGFVMWAALTTWWVVTAASGEENTAVGVLAALFAVSFVGASIYLSRRG